MRLFSTDKTPKQDKISLDRLRTVNCQYYTSILINSIRQSDQLSLELFDSFNINITSTNITNRTSPKMSAPAIPYSRTAAGLKTSRNNSSSSASSNESMNERRSSSVFKAMGHKLSQHNREVNAAYQAYYGVPRSSQESQRTLVSDEHYEVEGKPAAKQSKSSSSNAWQKVKAAAKEHHHGVNAAYQAYYGIR